MSLRARENFIDAIASEDLKRDPGTRTARGFASNVGQYLRTSLHKFVT
jgi:hypothetical protein